MKKSENFLKGFRNDKISFGNFLMTFVFHFIKVLLYLVDLLLYLVAVENVEQMKYILNAFRRFYERKQVVLCNCVVFHFFVRM